MDRQSILETANQMITGIKLPIKNAKIADDKFPIPKWIAAKLNTLFWKKAWKIKINRLAKPAQDKRYPMPNLLYIK